MYFNFVKNNFENYYDTLKDSKIKEIIKYSLEDGKCIRSFLIKHIMNELSNNKIDIWEPIIAIELIHGASLIIDDLPCMDNDEYRRNKLSTFKKFGERESILVSFYAISQAFLLVFNGLEKLTNVELKNNFTDSDKLSLLRKIINEWSELIGKNLIVGQMLDLKENIEELVNFKVTNNVQVVKNIMIYKTCSLFIFTFLLGGIFSGKEINLDDFKEMGYHFGIMFQIMDDYKDMKEDDEYANYILTNGILKAKEEYLNSKGKLLELLEKNNLATIKIIELIQIIDRKFGL
jgi:geranylgeranyl diphosphate synthase, type II